MPVVARTVRRGWWHLQGCKAIICMPVVARTAKRGWWHLQGCKAIICMPVVAPDIKVQAVKRLGGIVELVGETYTECQSYAQVPPPFLLTLPPPAGILLCFVDGISIL